METIGRLFMRSQGFIIRVATCNYQVLVSFLFRGLIKLEASFGVH